MCSMKIKTCITIVNPETDLMHPSSLSDISKDRRMVNSLPIYNNDVNIPIKRLGF